MKNSLDALATRLADLVGVAHLTPNPHLRLGAQTPLLLVEPANTAEVAATLRLCSEADAAVVPAGAMTWLDAGNPLRRADVVLSLRRMTRVVEYSPPDLTVTAEAGLALLALNDRLAAERLWLPLDAPGEARSTLGAVAACASYGGLRLGYGTPRDYVIGLRLAHVDGTESKAGGRVVKNVAGYDLNKLYVGSFGTLAVITELTFKLRPLPERFATLLITVKEPAANPSAALAKLAEAATRLHDAASLLPTSLLLAAQLPQLADATLLARFADSETAVAVQVQEVKRLLGDEFAIAEPGDAETAAIWEQIATLDHLAANTARLHLPLTAVAAALDDLRQLIADSVTVADVGVGTLRIAFPGTEERAVELLNALRRLAHEAAGSLFIESAPVAVRERCSAWEEMGGISILMRGIKKNFDPQAILNPGRFVAGI